MTRSLLYLTTILMAGGCVQPESEDETFATDESEVIGGIGLPSEGSGYAFLNVGCSGTLMTNRWVLTAAHCFDASDLAAPSTVTATMGSQTSAAAQIVLHPGADVALLRLATPFTMNGASIGFARTLYPLATNTLAPGTPLTCRGFGMSDWNNQTGQGTLRTADLPVRGVNFLWGFTHFDLAVDQSAMGQFLWFGDSGGSCLFTMPSGEQVVAGVQSITYHGVGGPFMGQISADTFRTWYAPIVGSATQSGWGQVAPNPIASDPATVSSRPDRIDAFARGTDGQMYWKAWTGSAWTGWTSLGGQFSSGPAVASVAADRLDVFARGMDSALWTNGWNGASWSGWTQVASDPITSDPTAVSWGPGRIDVFARRAGGQIHQISRTGNAWTSWSSLGGDFSSGPAVASVAADRLDVFARGMDSALWTNAWNGASWSGWMQVAPNPIASDPEAISTEPGRLDVFATGTDSKLYTLSRTGGVWTGWSSLGGGFTSGPAVASWAVDRFDVFGRGTDDALWTSVLMR